MGVDTYLDVDGVLLPMSGTAVSPWDDWVEYPFSVTASLVMGAALDPVVDTVTWSTTWRDLANEYVGPVFGWEPRPVLERKAEFIWWKLEAIGRVHKRGAPLIWVDDEIDERDDYNGGWVRSYIDNLTDTSLLVSPDPTIGLTPEDINRIVTFVQTHK